MGEVDTVNDFLLASNGQSIAPLLPVHITNKQQAYRTAAWLLAMSMMLPDDGTDLEFDEIKDAIYNT